MTERLKHLAPIGIGVFVLFYIYSASKYPGGSVMNSQSGGYDWFHNYWCDLMYSNSLNGELNLARPSAIVGWVILCTSILYILISILNSLLDQGRVKSILLTCAILAMIFGLFAFTDNHDLFVMLSFPFGAITVLFLAAKAQLLGNAFLRFAAWFVVVSLTVSFIMYFTSIGLYWIGFIQKVALGLSFIWIVRYYYHVSENTSAL